MEPEISDHALVRWLERIDGVDMETLRADIVERVRPLLELKAQAVPFGGHWLVFDGAKLVTVSPSKPKLHHKHDREYRNGTDQPREQMHWKAQARKRRG